MEWRLLDWKKIQTTVFKLQRRIYQASLSGRVRQVHRLQKTLLRSHYAKLLAVRRVTQDNRGKKTAGVDGIKTLTPSQRLVLTRKLKVSSKASPTRRVWISKPGTTEKRPLGIPTLEDRAKQALVKMALESEWEAKFEPNSYGFRPGRRVHDAIEAIYNAIRNQPKYVLDADIAKCFDCINHELLLGKINTFPLLTRQIRAWLKAGVMDGKFFPTEEGTPQGGVISPLLANIALQGMEKEVQTIAERWPGRRRVNLKALTLIRYADDFVIIHPELSKLTECKLAIEKWLKPLGLELKPSKTRIVHTLDNCGDRKPGFNFLGFNIRQYRVGEHASGRLSNGKRLGFKSLIKPAKEACKQHQNRIASVFQTHKAAPQAALISKLNPIIRGWSSYYSGVVASETFHNQDIQIYAKLRRWTKRRHPKKSRTWVNQKYFHQHGQRNWVFKDQELVLIQHSDKKIVRHIKVQGTRSPYDGDWAYWTKRGGSYPGIPKRISQLMKRQRGKCAICGLHFHVETAMEIDHIIPRSLGGEGRYNNLQLLHRHCHDVKTRHDRSLDGTRDKSYLRKEPDAGKLASPVL
ncbi:group II intron reverse transcriptase/maturase [Romeriopsis navalis]|uniref:group II intron reverse transcriptase/maturase n=1 Tax=Romeriopsis navalis TaxID=2992132 RepID=UPI0021F818D0|nr:group II intron reverse transcriptase/maturase [Romeriopsis navalis]